MPETDTTTYAVTASFKAGGTWVIKLSEPPHILGEIDKPDNIETLARKAIALIMQVDPQSFKLDVERSVPEPLATSITAWTELETQRNEIADQRSQLQNTVLSQARDLNLPVRTIAGMLGVSPGTVSNWYSKPNQERTNEHANRT